MEKNEITGIILAGGLSTRMGKDKGLIRFRGKMLIEHVLGILSDICGDIIISSNNPDYGQFGHRVIPDRFDFHAAINGIYSALEKSNTPHNLVVSCDTPFITTEYLKKILAKSPGNDFVSPIWSTERLEPLCAYYNKSIVGVLGNQISKKNYKLHELKNLVKFDFIPIGKDEEQLFANLNEPGLLKKYT